jgi:hypothetical protein
MAATGSGFGQNLITLQSGENATFYTNLDTALFYAKNGDDIYLPGGYIKANSETLKIDKAVNIIGVGYNPYTNPATENTVIQSQTIQILPNVNGGSISGIYAKNTTLQIDNNVSNFIVNRCLFSFINIGIPLVDMPPFNISIFETVVDRIQGNVGADNLSGPQNVLISNSILSNYNNLVLNGNGKWENLSCKNCIISRSDSESQPTLASIKNSLIENCIIIDNTGNVYGYGNENNTFRNCLFTIQKNTNWGNNFMINCILDQPQNSIFIDPQDFVFNIKNNFRLQDNSPGKNAGTDGTDIGIYGGRFPWKDGGLPANPHIESKFVNGTTDTNGNLNVNIKVEAQER